MPLLFYRNAAITYGKRGQDGTRVQGLRVAFSIDKTKDSNSNTSTITVYNFSQDTRSQLQKEKSIYINLEIGYGFAGDKSLEYETLFVGDITKITTSKQGVDYVTVFKVNDGYEDLNNAYINKSYNANTDIKDIVRDVIKTMSNTTKDIGKILQNITSEALDKGIAVSGMSKAIMDELMSRKGLEWNIQDNALQVLAPSQATTESAIVINKKTGLIGSVIKREEGFEFLSLISTTKFKPGRLVQIESTDVSGNFKIEKVEFNGDTHTDEWFVKCQVKEI